MIIENNDHPNRPRYEVLKMGPEEQRSFTYGIQQLYAAIKKINVEVNKGAGNKKLLTVLPMRGITPIFWALDEYFKLKHESLDEFIIDLHPPIGTTVSHHDTTYPTGGILPGQKHTLIKAYLETVITPRRTEDHKLVGGLNLKDKIGAIVIIDEVQKGGTISQLISILRKILLKYDLRLQMYVIAIHDSKIQGKTPYNKKYLDLQAENSEEIRLETIWMKLFVDMQNYLPYILSKDKASWNRFNPAEVNLEGITNPQAEAFFRKVIQDNFHGNTSE